jgi:hypothetical protein
MDEDDGPYEPLPTLTPPAVWAALFAGPAASAATPTACLEAYMATLAASVERWEGQGRWAGAVTAAGTERLVAAHAALHACSPAAARQYGRWPDAAPRRAAPLRRY